MPRRASVKLWLLAALVVLAHLLGLEWFARQADALASLTKMAAPMYTRMLAPKAPPPVVASISAPASPPPRPRAAVAPRPPASAPEKQAKKTAAEQPAPPAPVASEPLPPQLPVATAPQVTETVASAPAPAASEPGAAAPSASAASAAAADAAALDRWPADSRLTYRLNGHWRGPIVGDARVVWQREGDKYQVRLDVDLGLLSQVLTSQGQVTPNGLLPRIYEETRPGKRRVATLGDETVQLENGTSVPRPPGVQDTASQFVELSQRFATGKEVLAVGRSVTVWLARPGGVDHWTYDIVEKEMLRTPRLGDVEAFHLKPRPLVNARGNITAEMWFAPSLQYLPVKIKVLYGTDAHLDLLVDHIEQR